MLRRVEQQKQPAGTILVGDDEAPVLRVVQRILQRSGYIVIPAEDGQAAVEAFEAHEGTIDAVILDITMPRLSGTDAARQIRALDPNVKIIISSGYEAATATSNIEHGVISGFLQKPFTPNDLRATMQEVLSS
jgi:CheY-like chemotaxis protein